MSEAGQNRGSPRDIPRFRTFATTPRVGGSRVGGGLQKKKQPGGKKVTRASRGYSLVNDQKHGVITGKAKESGGGIPRNKKGRV